MKKTFFKILGISLLTLPIFAYSAEKILASGQTWKDIAIIDKASGKVEWSMTPPGAKVINCITMDKAGNIVLAGQNKIMKISRDKKVLWEYEVASNEETHFVKVLDNGNYLIGICATPSRLIEMDENKNIIKELNFDSKQTVPHSQFRHINETKDGTYLITILKGRELVEMDKSGKILSRDPLDTSKSTFGTIELKNGNLLVSFDAKAPKGQGEDSIGAIIEIDRKTKQLIRKIVPNEHKLAFPCQVIELDNGNLMIANWNGHSRVKDASKIIEVDKEGNVVWFLKDLPQVKNIASIYLFDE